MIRNKNVAIAQGDDYQRVVLWKRGSGATEIFNDLYDRADAAMKVRLLDAIPRPGENVDQVIAKIDASHFDEEDGIDIRKSASSPKGVTDMQKNISAADVNAAAMLALTQKAEAIHRAEPHLTKEQSFSKAFEQNPALARAERDSRGHYESDQGRLLDGLMAVAKATVMKGADFNKLGYAGTKPRTLNNVDAYGQLKALADEERRANPFLSEAQAFAQVYSRNPGGLATAERAQSYERLIEASTGTRAI
jgi:hypothetical protein